MMKNLGCASLTAQMFLNHQKDILPVWMRSKSELLQKLTTENRGLILGGDGRADSPGHSAKYGSYSLMELKMGSVINVELVQVKHYISCINCMPEERGKK